MLHNFASGVRAAAAPLTIELLERCGEWRTRLAIVRALDLPEGVPLQPMLDLLVETTFLERSDRAVSAAARGYSTWAGWNPAAGFFHATTKDVPFATPAAADHLLREKERTHRGSPPMVKRMSGGRRRSGVSSDAGRRAGSTMGPSGAGAKSADAESGTVPGARFSAGPDGRHAAHLDLPLPEPLNGLTDTLIERRTWRRFGPGPISRGDLATLLHLTWGIQQWMRVDGFGPMPLKTSPSGGARHSIEAYALVQHVEGLRPGLYHYGPDDHRLDRLPNEPRAKISDYLPLQTWYDPAAVVIFMTAVFERAQWRYGYARAYRSILIEAGHLAQTFCLVATRLGLAPFCSNALADSRIEADLGLDGATESVVYAVGAGRRPDGVSWAPWPNTDAVPARRAPAWARRAAGAAGPRGPSGPRMKPR